MVSGPRSRGCCTCTRSSNTIPFRVSGGSAKQCPRPDARATFTETGPSYADTMKLLGNSGYGKTITNVDRHRDVSYCTEKAASLLVNDKRFRQLDMVVDDAYEIELNKKTVKYTLPVHVGFFVLQYAKLAHVAVLLRFHRQVRGAPSVRVLRDGYRFRLFGLGWRVRRRPRDPDTTRTIISAIGRNGCRPNVATTIGTTYVRCRLANRPWVGDEACCKARRAFDKRTPGLFKVEWSGAGVRGVV